MRKLIWILKTFARIDQLGWGDFLEHSACLSLVVPCKMNVLDALYKY